MKISLWPSFVTKKKRLCMEILKMLIKAETSQIERFFEVTIHWWGIATLQTKNGSFKSHTCMKSYFGQFWNKIKKSCSCLQKVRRNMSTVELISGKVTDTAACNFLEKNSTAVVSQNFTIHFKQNKWNKLPLPSGRSQEKCPWWGSFAEQLQILLLATF